MQKVLVRNLVGRERVLARVIDDLHTYRTADDNLHAVLVHFESNLTKI